MNIKIVHLKRSGLKLPPNQLFNLSRNSKEYFLLSNNFTHLPLHKTKAKIQVNTVQEAVKLYKEQFYQTILAEVKLKEKPLTDIFLNLYNIYKKFRMDNKDMYLGCWCKDELLPKACDHECHCDVIKYFLIKKWEKDHVKN